MPDITLITPVCAGIHDELMPVLERWMSRQTADFEWVVVDEGHVPLTQGQRRVYRRREEPPEVHTLPQQVLAGLEHVRTSCVAVVEIDDWYGPGYVALCERMLLAGQVVGEARTRVYNVPGRGYLKTPHQWYSVLASTCFGPRGVPLLRSCCIDFSDNSLPQGVDIRVWQRWSDSHLLYVRPDGATEFCSMKGLTPGSHMHKPHDPKAGCFAPDYAGCVMLRRWVGDEAADLYAAWR